MKKVLTFGIAAVVIFCYLIFHGPNHAAETASTVPATTNQTSEIAALRAEVARLKSIATDQSHVMADVSYHFANLWFAGEKKNWPLAKFYFDETRAHINWAVRVIPVRKDTAGHDVDLKSIWQAVDQSIFSQIGNAIEQKDVDKFNATYRQGVEGCYACHKASSKPYLRPQIPKVPPQPMINFEPDAQWPP
jgi:hypothetical protein